MTLDPPGRSDLRLREKFGGEFALGGEEELVLQQIAKGECAFPRCRLNVGRVDLGSTRDSNLHDRARDHPMNQRVAVEASFVLTIRGDGVNRLDSSAVLLHHSFADHRAQSAVECLRSTEIDVRGERKSTCPHVRHQRFENRLNLRPRQCTTLVVEQGEREQCAGRDGSCGIDAVGDFKGHARDNGCGVNRPRPLACIVDHPAQRQGLAKPHVSTTPTSRLRARERPEPTDAFGSL